MPKQTTKARAKKAAGKEAMIPITALGGLQVPIIGTSLEAEVTQEQFARLRRIKLNGNHYIQERR